METLMLKKNLCVALLLLTCCSIFARFRVQVIYKNVYYFMEPYETTSYPTKNAKNLYVSRIIDKTQLHRIRLDSTQKSKLESLLFTGDSYTFNKVRLTLVHPATYPGNMGSFKIENLDGDPFAIYFTVADYDSVVLQSYINFYNPRWNTFTEPGNELDYITSAISVRILLDRLSGKIEWKSDLPQVLTVDKMNEIYTQDPDLERTIKEYYWERKNNGGYVLRTNLTSADEVALRNLLDKADFNFSKTMADKERIEAYENFIKQLASYGNSEEIFEKLVQFVSVNITAVEDYDIHSDWIKPYNLLYTRKGDYKSIAFFYYHTFKRLGLNCEAFFTVPLEKKEKQDFTKDISWEEIENELIKHNIDVSTNLNIKKYKYPEFADARLIVAFKYKKSWRYTSGVQWIQTDLQDKTGERITAHYSKNGCYYMKLNEDLSGRIENAQPIIDGVGTKTLQWSVFLDISKEP
jgi:hypothetical protein